MTRQNAVQTQQQSASASPLSRGGILQRQCDGCGQHTIAGGECGDCGKKKIGLQRKLTIGASNDPLELEADQIAEAVVNSSHAIQPVTATAANLVVQRQPDDVQKPRDQPSTFPVEEQPKVGQEREDAEKEKLKKGALKAASEFAQLLWENFSASQTGMYILEQNEHDWQAVIKFFKDFADTVFGKIVLGASAGGAATGAFLGASSSRDKSVVPDPSSGGATVSRAPKDEKFFALELKWDFISSPSGVTIKTPWLDSPKFGGGSKSNTPTTLPPAPQLIKPMLKIPKICTPADPGGDHGEADARSAQIYSWLLWKQQQDADKMNELLRKYMQPIQAPGEILRSGQPYTFKQSQVSTIKPLFKRSDGATEVADRQAIDAGLHSSAQSLDPTTRSDMEKRFGHDFSRVRVHTDQAANQSAKAVNALAYTVGSHVVFGSNQYAPTTSAGRRLLAHELAHVLQQSDSPPSSTKLEIADSDLHEQEAERTAEAVATGQIAVTSPLPASHRLARFSDTGHHIIDEAGLTGAGFSEKQIKVVEQGNIQRDYSQVGAVGNLLLLCQPEKFGGYQPEEHFDNFIFDAITNRWRTRGTGKAFLHQDPNTLDVSPIDYIKTELNTLASKGMTEKSLVHLGNAFHTVEDFFAHSNFVELINKGLPYDGKLLTGSYAGESANSEVSLSHALGAVSGAPMREYYERKAEAAAVRTEPQSHSHIAKDTPGSHNYEQAQRLAALVIQDLGRDVLTAMQPEKPEERVQLMSVTVLDKIRRYLHPPNQDDRWWEDISTRDQGKIDRHLKEASQRTPVTVNQCIFSPLRNIEASSTSSWKLPIGVALPVQVGSNQIWLQVGGGITTPLPLDRSIRGESTRSEQPGGLVGGQITGRF